MLPQSRTGELVLLLVFLPFFLWFSECLGSGGSGTLNGVCNRAFGGALRHLPCAIQLCFRTRPSRGLPASSPCRERMRLHQAPFASCEQVPHASAIGSGTMRSGPPEVACDHQQRRPTPSKWRCIAYKMSQTKARTPVSTLIQMDDARPPPVGVTAPPRLWSSSASTPALPRQIEPQFRRWDGRMWRIQISSLGIWPGCLRARAFCSWPRVGCQSAGGQPSSS